MKKSLLLLLVFLLFAGCGIISSKEPDRDEYIFGPRPGATLTITKARSRVPAFDHIILILFENRDFQSVMDDEDMLTFNQLADANVLLTNYYAVAHPSLPNYIAMISGDTFDITENCTDCFINDVSLADLIEASGRTWKTYQEDIPSPCFIGDSGNYRQKHNPFVYFDPIRKNPARCNRSVVSLKQLDLDLAANQLPNFAFIMPNMCNSAHDCTQTVADDWLKSIVNKLQSSSALGQNYLIFIAFEEGSHDDSSCCGLPAKAGGRVMAILVSPQAKQGFRDATPLSHYSLLKTIMISWNLMDLGYTSNPATLPITAPWK